MKNTDKKYGRTLFDLIAEHPKTMFLIIIILLLLVLSLLLFKIPFKIGNVEVGDNTKIVHDTTVKIKVDTQYINTPGNEIIQTIPITRKTDKGTKTSVKRNDTVINVQNQPANINTGTNNGIIGNNGIINQSPAPTLEVSDMVYQDQKINENITKKNKKLVGYENIECYKTVVKFEYNSENKKDYIDFKILNSAVLHMEMKKLNEIFETSTWLYQDKVVGIRFFNPTNGAYEMTIYTSSPIMNIWNSFRFYVNNKESQIKAK